MFNDIESDFWKEQLSTMQKNNLLRKDSDKLYMSDCEEKFEEFKLLHPELVIESTCGANYCSLEFFVTQNIVREYNASEKPSETPLTMLWISAL